MGWGWGAPHSLVATLPRLMASPWGDDLVCRAGGRGRAGGARGWPPGPAAWTRAGGLAVPLHLPQPVSASRGRGELGGSPGWGAGMPSQELCAYDLSVPPAWPSTVTRT